MLGLLIHEHGIFFHLLRYSLIFCSFQSINFTLLLNTSSFFLNVALKAFPDLYYLREHITPPRYMDKRNHIHVYQQTHKRMSIATLYVMLDTTQMLINSKKNKFMVA